MTTRALKFVVVSIPELVWPSALNIPSKRFRLLVAANTLELSVEVISAFALAASERGMVYFCSWGPGCERFHDIVDEVEVEDSLGPQKFAGAKPDDVIMTTWHDDEPLEEGLRFLAQLAVPTEGFAADSDFRIVICAGNSDWRAQSEKFLQSCDFV
jgi:hypothetical protein